MAKYKKNTLVRVKLSGDLTIYEGLLKNLGITEHGNLHITIKTGDRFTLFVGPKSAVKLSKVEQDADPS